MTMIERKWNVWRMQGLKLRKFIGIYSKKTTGIKPVNIPLTAFEQYFKAINNPTDQFYIPVENIIFFNERYEQIEFDIMFEDLNTFFYQEEILKAISQLKTKISGGPHKIINEFFIHGKMFYAYIMQFIQ